MPPLLAIPGAIAGAVQAIFVGLILGYVIVEMNDTRLDGHAPADTIDITVAAIAGALAGGALAARGKGRKKHLLTLWARVAPVAACWPFWRLAGMQTVWETRAVFYLLGGWLAMVGVVVIAQLFWRPTEESARLSPLGRKLAGESSRRLADYLLYLSAASAILLFGAFLCGEYTATFERSAEGVQGVLTRTRWLGWVETERATLHNVHGWQRVDGNRAIELLTDNGPVRVAGDPDYYLPLPGRISHSLDDFLASTRPELVLRETTPWLPFPVIMLLACAALGYGAFFDPWADFSSRLKKTIVVTTILCALLAGMSYLLSSK